MNRNTWAIIPAKNEGKTLIEVISKTKKHIENIVVVDDGSDNPVQETEGVKVITHLINLGKGSAARLGCDYAIRKGAEVLVLLDGDGQHNADEIPNLLKALENKDIVFAYRKFTREMPLILKLGNMMINRLICLVFNIKLRDALCGYKCFTARIYGLIKWRSSRYELEMEIAMNTSLNKLKYAEVETQTRYNDRFKGTTPIDGIRIVANIFWLKLRRMIGC